MNAIEFSSKIEKGRIIVPQQYQEYDNENVRIIMLFEENKKEKSKKENLLTTFNKMKSNKMFASIENPVLWQKELRNEWE